MDLSAGAQASSQRLIGTEGPDTFEFPSPGVREGGLGGSDVYSSQWPATLKKGAHSSIDFSMVLKTRHYLP